MKHSVASLALVAGTALLAYPLLSIGAFAPMSTRATVAAPQSTGTERRTLRAMERLRVLLGPDANVAMIRPPSALTRPPVDPLNRVGVYLTSGRVSSDGYLDEAIENVTKAGGNAIIFDVKGSRVYFDTTSPIAEELQLEKAVEDLPAIIKKLHDHHLYAMGRFIAIKDDGFTAAYPAASVRHPVSQAVISSTWIDPSNEYAQQYNMEVLCDLAAAGIDEVNFDYIRFSTENFGALGVFSGQEKADKVLSFVKKARETIDRCGPSTKLGISSYAILGWNYPVNLETLGQDVVRFAPYVDVISPMAYPATFAEGAYWNPAKNKGSRMYYLVYRTLTGYTDLLADEDKKKIRPWLQGYSVTQQNVQDQIQAVFDAGYCGFQFWNASNNYAAVYAGIGKMTWPDHCEKEEVAL